MNRFFLALLCLLLSCGPDKGKQPAKPQDALKKVSPDTTNIQHSAFNWDGERRTEKIILPAAITKYISTTQEPMDTFSGDVNNDNIPDLILVTRMIGEDTIPFSRDYLFRELLVFSGQQNKSHKFLFKNARAIPCRTCCGMSDPYAGMKIKKGQIIINEYCGSNWKAVSEYRFRYNTNLADWLLDTIVRETYAFHYEHYKLDTTTQKDFGKKSLRTFEMYKEEE